MTTSESVGPGGRKEFDRLTVLSFSRRADHHVYWLVRCTCGTEKEVRGSSLLDGSTVSCGCKRQPHKATNLTGLRTVYHGARGAAKARSIDWDLTWKQYQKIVSQPCAYCGLEPPTREVVAYAGRSKNRPGKKHLHTVTSNGIDRIDNTVGYTVENAAPCCTKCNHMKRDWTANEFLAHVARIYNHRP